MLDARAEEVDGIIWTDYRVQVLDSVKGTNDDILTVSEPGGELNGIGMIVQGASKFEPARRTCCSSTNAFGILADHRLVAGQV